MNYVPEQSELDGLESNSNGAGHDVVYQMQSIESRPDQGPSQFQFTFERFKKITSLSPKAKNGE